MGGRSGSGSADGSVSYAPPVDAPVAKNTPLCHGCGRYHGGVNAKLRCLEYSVAKLRGRLKLYEPNTKL